VIASQSRPLRTFFMLLWCVLGTLSIVSLAGGPDPLDEWWSPIFGAMLLSWFLPELRDEQEESRWIRVTLWIGVLGAAAMLVTGLAELLS
jgi:hypothetical protein